MLFVFARYNAFCFVLGTTIFEELMAENSQNVEQPCITINGAEYCSDVNLNSTMNLEHLEANCLIPSSPQRVSLSPKGIKMLMTGLLS